MSIAHCTMPMSIFRLVLIKQDTQMDRLNLTVNVHMLKYPLQSPPAAGRSWHCSPTADTEGRSRLATTPSILSKLAVMWGV